MLPSRGHAPGCTPPVAPLCGRTLLPVTNDRPGSWTHARRLLADHTAVVQCPGLPVEGSREQAGGDPRACEYPLR